MTHTVDEVYRLTLASSGKLKLRAKGFDDVHPSAGQVATSSAFESTAERLSGSSFGDTE